MRHETYPASVPLPALALHVERFRVHVLPDRPLSSMLPGSPWSMSLRLDPLE